MRAALLDGIVLGLQYGLLGVGLTLIYGLAGVLNLAHGQVAVLGAIVVSLLMEDGMSVAAAVAVGIVGASAFMMFLDLTLMRAVYHQEGERRILLGLLLMLGVSFAIDGFVTWRYPVQQLRIRVEGDAVVIVGVPMPVGALLASAIAIAIGLLLVGFFRLTTLGRGVRSVIQDEAGARLCGVNPSAVRTLVFGMSGALACLVAVTRSMTGPIGFSNAIGFTTLALIVAVVGGLGSVSGAFLAGVLLGVVDRLSSTYIGTYVTTIALLVCAALTIVLRPSGLLGRPE
ncbi:MAG TPA: branched-chain amino acid ABC transporter permease [Acidimicrobiales bacterium]|jgi:branched-chain amino acid transport system permease protein|nr:branched-chain amino acid ABC transporter permease [Acidimicrobiales bacterium]